MSDEGKEREEQTEAEAPDGEESAAEESAAEHAGAEGSAASGRAEIEAADPGARPIDVTDPQIRARRAESFWAWLRTTARLWGFFGFILVVVVAFRGVILPFILALLVTYVLSPVLRHLSGLSLGGRRLPRVVWLVAVYALLLGLLGLFVTAFVPRVTKDFKRVVREAPLLIKKVNDQWVPTVAAWVERNFGADLTAKGGGKATPASQPAERGPQRPPRIKLRRLPDGQLEVDARALRLEVTQTSEGRWLVQVPSEQPTAAEGVEVTVQRFFKELVTSSEKHASKLFAVGRRFIGGLLSAITTFILVLMISVFLLIDTERILGWLRALVPRKHWDDFDNVIELIDRGLGGAIRGQLLICLVNGVLTWVGLVLIGVNYALLLALLAGVMSLIPIFGSILSSIPIVIVAMVSGSAGIDVLRGLMVLAWIIGIHLVEANLLNPKIIGTAAKIHPVIVIFSVVAGERTYGPIGALLAVPIVSAVQAMFVYVRAKVRGDLEVLADSAVRRRRAGR